MVVRTAPRTVTWKVTHQVAVCEATGPDEPHNAQLAGPAGGSAKRGGTTQCLCGTHHPLISKQFVMLSSILSQHRLTPLLAPSSHQALVTGSNMYMPRSPAP
jgi:hypothetical protein